MKKKWIIPILILLFGSSARAEELETKEPELKEMAATIYCTGKTTADGSKAREGICAVDPENMGKTVLIYTLERELIGIFEAKDTGGRTIQNGTVIDVFFESRESGQHFIEETYKDGAKGRVLVQFIDAEG